MTSTFLEEIITYNEDMFDTTKCFLNEIFLDLTMRADESLLNYSTFHDFLQIPMIISEKMFDILSKGKEMLTKDQFVNGLSLLFSGPLQNKIKTVFQIFDFDHDNIISEQDIRLLFLHFHFHISQNPFTEIQEILVNWLNSMEAMDYQTFYESVTTRNSDVFILFLIFLFKFRPFSEKQIHYFYYQRKTFCQRTRVNSEDQIPIAVPSARIFKYISQLHLEKPERKINDYPSTELLCFTIESDKIKQCKLALIDDVLFYYKYNPMKRNFQLFNLLTLKSTFIIECEEVIINNQSYFPFQLTSSYNSNQFIMNFLGTEEKEIKSFVDLMKCCSNDRNVTDFYSLGNEIGSGSYGSVRVGFSILTGENVAIKIVEKNRIGMDAIKREVDIFKLLKNAVHPGIIQAIDIFENLNFLFFVYEYISGGDLKSYMKRKTSRITSNELKSFSDQLIDAVGYLHHFGIVHRDIKPANILVKESTEGEVVLKLSDFGFSKVMGFNEKTTEHYGSLIYTAPEIILGIPYSHQVDIWSLGVVLYNMLTGYHPFSDAAGCPEKVKEAIISSDFIFPEKDATDSSLFYVVESCLSKNFTNRPGIEEIINIQIKASGNIQRE